MDRSRHVLWYTSSARNWNEALPIGNGRIGAMVYGGAEKETLSLNEDTLWSGRPAFHMPPAAEPAQVWAKARSLAHEKRYTEAQTLLEEQFTATPTEMYLPLGDLTVESALKNPAAEYTRELDLRTAVHTVRFADGATVHERRSFISFPDQVLVERMEAKNGSLCCSVAFSSQLRTLVEAENGVITVEGVCPTTTIKRGDNQGKAVQIYEEEKPGIRFACVVKATTDGVLTAADGALQVENASCLTLYFTVRTNFAGWDQIPENAGKRYREPAMADAEAAARKGFDALLAAHIADHTALYDRTELELEDVPESLLPTNERLERREAGESDPALYALLFHYGRYLTIASSRPGTQPTNLQGIWNHLLLPPWHCNMTININTQMNYWPTLRTNLEECYEPLLGLISDLSVSGRRTAQRYYGAKGFTAHHNTDLWRLTTPVGNGQPGCAVFAVWPLSGGWFMNHLDAYYRFTGDRKWLAETGYPIMRECAAFFASVLDEDGEGKLVFCPSTSPEHNHHEGTGECPVSETTAMTMALIRDVFRMNVAYAALLGKPEDAQAYAALLPRLKGYALTSTGAIEEWAEHQEPVELHHRHLSHLIGNHPLNEISPTKTPELAQAVRQTLEERGDLGTGWSLAWKVNHWARLGDGDHALKLIDMQLHPVADGATYPTPGGSYPNLLDAHPPFQIDGNFGVCAGIAEMLLQNDGDSLRVLPALPSAWKNGCVRGLRAYGGKTVDIRWQNGQAAKVTVR